MLDVFVGVCVYVYAGVSMIEKKFATFNICFHEKTKETKSTTHPRFVSSTKQNGFDVFDSVLVSCLAFFYSVFNF